MKIKESIERNIETIKEAAKNAGNVDSLKGKVSFDLINHPSAVSEETVNNPKSLNNDFNLMDLDSKVETIYDDAINCPLHDGMLSIKINDGKQKEQYNQLLAEIKYCDLSVDELTDKIMQLTKICCNSGIKIYQIVRCLLNSDTIKELKSEVFRNIIKRMLQIEVPVPTVNGVANNVIDPSPYNSGATAQLNEPTGIDANSIINSINTNEYTELDNAVKWLTDNVKFGCKIDGTGEKVSQQEAINLYKLFTWPEAMAEYNKYCPVKEGNKRLWFRLENHELLKNNIYKYVFGAISGSFPGKRIIFACNPDTMLWTAYLE